MKKNSKPVLVSWLVVPVFGISLTTNFLINKIENKNKPAAMVTQYGSPEEVKMEIDKRFYDFNWKGEGLVTFWFDDAWISQYTNGFTILDKKDIVGALAVPTNMIGLDGYMNWYQIKRIQFEGWEVNSHSRNHSCNEERVDNTAELELKVSKEELEEKGLVIYSYVAPCGVITPKVKEYAPKVYSSLRTTEWGLNPLPITDPYKLTVYPIGKDTRMEDVQTWINRADQEKSWLILMFHQIDYSNKEYSTTPEFLEDVANRIKDSKLRVVLPTQVINNLYEK